MSPDGACRNKLGFMAAIAPNIAELMPYFTDAELKELEFLAAEKQRFADMTADEECIEARRAEAGKNPAAFFRASWNVLEPGKDLEWSWHYDLIGEYLQAAFLRQIRRLIINVPPRTAKSSEATICFPAWVWTRQPGMRFLTASHSSGLSGDHSAARRRLIESRWYQNLWPLEFTRDTNRRDQYRNTAQGEMIATSVGSSEALGKGGDILIVDDAMNPAEARSAAKIKELHEWFPNVFRQRLNDPATGVIIVIEQRTGENDLTGWLKTNEPGQWQDVVVPLEAPARKEYSFPISGKVHARETGDVLQPRRHTPEVIANRKIHTRTWATQDQQQPAPDSGIVFLREWWKYRGTPRAKYDQIITTWDFAVEGNADSDYNAAFCLGKCGADIDVLDAFKARLPFPQQQQAVVNFAISHPLASRHLVEKKANGPAIIAVEPQGSKLQRADASTPECEAGNVYLIEAPWNHEFVEHMAMFPNGANDDWVDAFAQGVNWLRGHNYSYGLLTYAAQQAAGEQQKVQEYMESAKMTKPDTGVQTVTCINCKSTAVVRIGNNYRCNSCSASWPAVKTAEFDPKIFTRGPVTNMRK
jgi:predicted phage terminase large subunit-like protein